MGHDVLCVYIAIVTIITIFANPEPLFFRLGSYRHSDNMGITNINIIFFHLLLQEKKKELRDFFSFSLSCCKVTYRWVHPVEFTPLSVPPLLLSLFFFLFSFFFWVFLLLVT